MRADGRRHSVLFLTLLLVLGVPGMAANATQAATAPDRVAAAGLDPWVLWSGDTQLRGANIYQRRVYPELDGSEILGSGAVGPPYSQADFDSLAALGANYVNISHPGLFSESPPYLLDEAVQANLDDLLKKIAAADMFAVISFRTGPGRSEFTFFSDRSWFDDSYLNDTVWVDQAAQDAWVAMWRYTADRYCGNPIVVGYDLMVEPNSNGVYFDEWDPRVFHSRWGGTLYDWNQLYPRITTAIREVDTAKPILICGNGYGGIAWLPYLSPTSDTRTVYLFHQYAPHVYTHQNAGDGYTYPGVYDVDWDGRAEQFDRDWLDQLLSTADDFSAAHGVALAVNEYGVIRWAADAGDFLADQVALLEERGLNHALWVWNPVRPLWNELVNSFDFRFGPDPDSSSVVANELLDAITAAWASNTMRPSTSTNLAGSIYLPAAAHLAGVEGARWRTDLQVKAVGEEEATVAISLLRRDRDNSEPMSRSYTIAQGVSTRFEDVLSTVFAFEGGAALRVTPLAGKVIVSSRTYNDLSGGTYGQYIPGYREEDAIPFGSDAEIIQLTRSADSAGGYRSNLGLVNLTAQAITVQVALFTAQCDHLGDRSYTLQPYGHIQVTDIFGVIEAGQVEDGYAVLRSSTEGATFLAYASVIDNQTNDPVFIPAQVVSDLR